MALARSRDATVLLAAALVDSAGTGCFLAGSIIFFTRSVGLAGTEVGFGLSLAAALGFVATIPVGRVADRRGSKPVLIALLGVRAMGFALYAASSSFVTFLIAAAVVGLAEKPTSAVQQLLISDVVGEEHRQRVMARTRSMRNVGIGAGSMLAAVVLLPGVPLGARAIVLANACSFVIAALLVAGVTARGAHSTAASARVWRLRDREYLRLTAVNGLLSLHMTLLATALPLWILTASRLPEHVVPALVLANTVLAVLFQVPVATRVATALQAKRMLRTAGAALGACCMLLAPLGHVTDAWALVLCAAALVALTAAELTQAAGGWDLSFRLAPDARRGHYLSFFSLGVTAQTIVGPWFLASIVLPGAPIGWCVLGALVPAVAFGATRTRMTCDPMPPEPAERAPRVALTEPA